MEQQSLDNQKAEIEFRKKLVRQQVEGVKIFDNELDARDIQNILDIRMKKTLDQMTRLKEKKIVLSPYVEIGAERCQRSLVMENDLGANGAAVDISYEMLKAGNFYKDIFKKDLIPARICCDANNLPFMSNSIPFIFCYETLHHFPDPTLITKEIHRVLSGGGCFFFAEEPYRQSLRIKLYKGKKLYSPESIKRSTLMKVIDHFFSEQTCNEVEHGILENHDISIGFWKQALMYFDEKDVTLRSTNFLQSQLLNPDSIVKYILAYLLGGSISGICTKSGNITNRNKSIYEFLICPSCKESGYEVLLTQHNSSVHCPKCRKIFPILDGVLFLFSYSKFKELYPEIFENLVRG